MDMVEDDMSFPSTPVKGSNRVSKLLDSPISTPKSTAVLGLTESPSKVVLDSFLRAIKIDLPDAKKDVSITPSIREKLPFSYNLMIQKQNSSLGKKQQGNDKVSSYNPWSRKHFLLRLSTYTYKNWDIPSELKDINSVQCAKQGWKCVDEGEKDTIQCVSCNKLLNIKLGENANIYEVMCKMYKERLVNQHHDSCQWKRRWCKDDIYEITTAMSVQKPLISERYESLTCMKELVYFKFTYEPVIEELGEVGQVDSVGDVATVDKLDNTSIGDSRDSIKTLDIVISAHNLDDPSTQTPIFLDIKNINPKYLIIALLGWKKASANPPILSCDLCFRRILVNKELTNLNNQHEAYCPYIQKDNEGSMNWLKIYNTLRVKKEKRSPDQDLTDDQYITQRKERLSNLRKIYLSNK